MLKITPFDTLRNEIASEKFAAFSRISEHLSQSLKDLEILESDIRKAVEAEAAPAEINKLIDAFNRLHEDAKEWRHYLTVTREAAGFFTSGLSADAYKIPPRKELLADSAGLPQTHLRGKTKRSSKG
jgi:hypothetical protein